MESPIVNKHYYTHLESKSTLRCVVLLIPVLGNIIVALYDFRKNQARAALIACVDTDPTALRSSNKGAAFDFAFRDDEEIAKLYVAKHCRTFDCLGERLQRNREIASLAVKQEPIMMIYVREPLKSNLDFALEVIKEVPLAIFRLPDTLKQNEKVILAFLNSPKFTMPAPKDQGILPNIFWPFYTNPKVIGTLIRLHPQDNWVLMMCKHTKNNPIFENEEFMQSFCSINPDLGFKYLGEKLKTDKNWILDIVQKNGLILKFAIDTFKDDKQIVLAAVRQNGHALEFASNRLRDDEEVVHTAIQIDYSCNDNLLSDDSQVMKTIYQNNKDVFKFASENLKRKFGLEDLIC